MAGIFANVESDINKLKQLKEQIDEVKKALKSIDVKVDIDIAKGMEAQLKNLTTQYDALVQKVSQAEGKIIASTQRINQAAEKITKAQEQLAKATGAQQQTGSATGNNTAANQAETASVQAQAKAYDELADEIDAVMGTRSQNIRRMIEEQNAIRLINEEIKKLTKYQGENSTLSSSQQRRLEQLNASLLQHKTALSELRQSLNNSFKIDNSAATSMNALSQSLGRMRMAYRELTEEERKSPFGQELLASIQQADAKIKQLDATIGNHQRNVGNYASGWNGLNMSVQQIVRELPAATMGLNMFFLAISNNLPILTDEIKRARDMNEQLKKSGQSTVPVWKQLVSSIFSWQTAMMVAITVLSMYGGKIIDWVSGLSKAKKEVEDVGKNMQNLNRIMTEGASSSAKERAQLDLLYHAAQDQNRSMKERIAAVEELKRQYPDYFGKLTNEAILAGNASEAYKQLTDNILKAAQARSAMKIIEENYDKIFQLQKAVNADTNWINRNAERAGYGKATEKRTVTMNSSAGAITQTVEGLTEDAAEFNRRQQALRDNLKQIDRLNKENKALADQIDTTTITQKSNQATPVQSSGKSPFRRTELDYSKELEKRIKETEERTMEASLETYEMSAAEQSAMNRYLSEYGTFQQRRLAITQEYQQKIAAATTEGEKLTLQKQVEEALSDINMDELKESINWELVFSDLENVSKQSLQKIKKQLSDFKDSAEYKEMTVDQKQVIDEALNNIQSAIIDKGGLLGDLPAQLEELRKAQEELNNAQDEYNRALAEGTDEQKQAATQKLNKAQQGVSNAQKNVEQSTKKTTDNFLTLADAITQLGGSSEMTLTQVGQLAGSIADSFAEAGSKIGGIIGAIFSLLDQIGKQGLDGFLENVFSSVGSALYGVFDTLLGWTGINFGGESDPHLEEDLERLAISNQELEKALNNLSEKMDESSVAEASDIYEVQKENIEKQMANTWESMWRSLNASSSGFMGIGGSHSTNYKINHGMTAEDWKAISDAVGKSVTDASDFFSLTSEEMWKAANGATTEYSKLKELADDGYKDAAQYMDDYIGYWQELEELQDEYNEKLTSVSFDTIQSDFRNAILGMTDDSEAFAENFEKLMQQAVLESMMTNTYDKQLRKWYESFSSYMEGGELTKGEQEALRKDWQDIVDKASEEWKMWQETMGWDTSSSAQQQQSSRGSGFETMTQDQASELSGRFTAVYEGELRIESAVGQQTLAITDIKGSISDLVAQARLNYNVGDEVRTILAQSYIELQGINENTGAIVKPIQQMQKDMEEVKRNTSRL